MEKFNPETARHYAELIAYPRAVGTPGEITARHKITDLLEGMGLKVETQPFSFSTAYDVFLKIEIMTSQILILVALGLLALQSNLAFTPVSLLVLLIIFLGPLNRKVQIQSLAPKPGEKPSLWNQLCYSMGSRYATENILADLSTGSDEKALPHLFLVAHSDSKSQRISLVTRITLFVISISGSLFFAILVLFEYIAPSITVIAEVVAVIVLATSFPLLFLDFGNDSPGAIDNASGVGLVLHLAEMLAAQPHIHERVRITILITSAEELATMGALSFVKDHQDALKEQARNYGVHVLNFDGIGVQGNLYLVTPRTPPFASEHRLLKDILRDSCNQLGVKLRSFALPGALYDHIPFAAAGFDAVSLITIGKNSGSIHSADDTADKLDSDGFEKAGRLALNVIHDWNTSKET